MINNENKHTLIQQKKKAQRCCLNLECENEQLNLLIDNLNQISLDREEKISTRGTSSLFYNQFQDILLDKSTVTDKLEVAKNKKNYLEQTIQSLKEQIKQIDNHLKNK